MDKPKQNLCYLCKDELKDSEKEITKDIKRAIIDHWIDSSKIRYTPSFNRTRMHKECWNAVPIQIRRKATGKDFTEMFLNIEKEIMVKLDEKGDVIWESSYSLDEKIDKKLQCLKKKTNRSKEEEEWLRNALS